MLLSPRKNGLTSLFKEVRVFKGGASPGEASQFLGATKTRQNRSKTSLACLLCVDVHARVGTCQLYPNENKRLCIQ